MKIAFYYSKNGNIVDHLINMFSGRDGFSHVELVFDDGESCSSSPRDGGVRFKKGIDFYNGHWRPLIFPVTSINECTIREFCEKHVGKKYNFAGVFGFVLPTRMNQDRWFCSEIVVAALQSAGFLGRVRPWKVSPNSLYLILESERKKFYVT